jgi:hypothetical protein
MSEPAWIIGGNVLGKEKTVPGKSDIINHIKLYFLSAIGMRH